MVESEHNREKSIAEEKSRKKSKREKHRKSSIKEDRSLESCIDFPVDAVTAELQKVISDLHVENQKLTTSVTRKDAVIYRLKEDVEKLQVKIHFLYDIGHFMYIWTTALFWSKWTTPNWTTSGCIFFEQNWTTCHFFAEMKIFGPVSG